MNEIKEIIDLEWEMFKAIHQSSKNSKDQDTFRMLRHSQFKTWPEPLLNSYLKDLKESRNDGWNIMMEKYARMLKTTAPSKYKEIENILPIRDTSRTELTEEIVRVQVKWAENFSKEYPVLSTRMNKIHTSDDKEEAGSVETEIRSELLCYSDLTFKLYCEFIIDLVKHNQNLIKMVMENIVKFQGYDSLYSAEK